MKRPLLLIPAVLLLVLVTAATPRSAAQTNPSGGIPVHAEATVPQSGAPQSQSSNHHQVPGCSGCSGHDLGGMRGAPLPSGGIGSPLSYSKATPKPRIVLVRSGIASTYGPGWDGWIAWPDGPGWKLRVCGPGGCLTVVSTDAGPDKAMQRKGRVVDLDVATFEGVCGVPWWYGLCDVSVQVLGR